MNKEGVCRRIQNFLSPVWYSIAQTLVPVKAWPMNTSTTGLSRTTLVISRKSMWSGIAPYLWCEHTAVPMICPVLGVNPVIASILHRSREEGQYTQRWSNASQKLQL